MSAGYVGDVTRNWYVTGRCNALSVDKDHPEDDIEERIHTALRGAGITFQELIVVEQYPASIRGSGL